MSVIAAAYGLGLNSLMLQYCVEYRRAFGPAAANLHFGQDLVRETLTRLREDLATLAGNGIDRGDAEETAIITGVQIERIGEGR